MDKRSILFVVLLAAALYFVHQYFDTSTQKPPAPAPTAQESPATDVAVTSDESYYVLENDYQQLVFSSRGGALVEINLPFQSKKNEQSIVLEVEADEAVLEDSPENATFPLFPAEGVAARSKGGYYPLLRRGVIKNGHLQGRDPEHYAFNIVSKDPSLAKATYSVTHFDARSIQFEASVGGRKIVKTFSFVKDAMSAPYCIELEVRVDGDASGLMLTSGVPEVELISGSPAPTLKYLITRKGKSSIVETIDLPKESKTFASIQPEWVSNSNGFFGILINPLGDIGSGFVTDEIPGKQDPTRMVLVDAKYDLYPAEKYPGYQMMLPIKDGAKYRLFAGPYEDDILKLLDKTFSNPADGYFPSFISAMSFQGWFTFVSEPFAKFLFFLMKFFHFVTRSWGVSLILLTIALRVMLYPLNAWSIKSSLRMQQIAPKVAQLQEKYKKDKKRAQMEVIALYREKGVNPLTGCLPLLIQIPFLIGMFDLLKSAFELRGADFIPGWINNLTAPDVLFSWNYPLFFFGTNFHLLPLLLGLTMYWQQKISSPTPKDPSLLTDQQKQQRTMGNVMSIVFAVMFYHFPSGLNLYWLFSTLLGILQQWISAKKLKP